MIINAQLAKVEQGGESILPTASSSFTIAAPTGSRSGYTYTPSITLAQITEKLDELFDEYPDGTYNFGMLIVGAPTSGSKVTAAMFVNAQSAASQNYPTKCYRCQKSSTSKTYHAITTTGSSIALQLPSYWVGGLTPGPTSIMVILIDVEKVA